MKILNQDLNKFDAILFDLDGTLLDSMPFHNKAWLETLHEFGAPMQEAFLWETAGMASIKIVELVNERLNLQLDPKVVARAKRDRYLKNVDQVTVVQPVLDIIKEYYQKKPLGVITGGSHEVVDQLLPSLKLEHYFDSIICSDDTELGKNTVEPYRLAESQLKVEAKNCLFLDDGDIGLKGAQLAGMRVVHVDINSPEIFINLV
jgi:HAD superfamily hydrolase (TIGR01509 family)